ncbi:hypothetical protein [Micromonospora inyonensis]|uniref:Uncharacterized protein n=1 Tax=Micromonospora inyonensis TaxID=47866 RepID=A0A1C6RD87_9ACTN|nr:hypothetical protein [Micromonospora inyonensis]SCL15049.1 hypothetical protein GA0074694_1030 [Micromonospora inyonensis]
MPLLYGLCDEWTARRHLLAALSGEPDPLNDALDVDQDHDGESVDEPAAAGGPSPGRLAEIAALSAACG